MIDNEPRPLWPDWTADDGGTANASPLFERIVSDIESLLLSNGNNLIAGQHPAVARNIVARMAHVHSMVPADLNRPDPEPGAITAGGPDALAAERLRTIVTDSVGWAVRNGAPTDEALFADIDPSSARFERMTNEHGVPMRRVGVVTAWEVDPDA